MAKDDYFVITYKLLKILYEALKHGKFITADELNELSSSINHEYWIYILATLSECGYISGVEIINTLTGKDIKVINIQITPKGTLSRSLCK